MHTKSNLQHNNIAVSPIHSGGIWTRIFYSSGGHDDQSQEQPFSLFTYIINFPKLSSSPYSNISCFTTTLNLQLCTYTESVLVG
jgi:hypothetical protein